MPKIIFQPLMICNPPSRNVLTYYGSADLQSAAIKETPSGLTLDIYMTVIAPRAAIGLAVSGVTAIGSTRSLTGSA